MGLFFWQNLRKDRRKSTSRYCRLTYKLNAQEHQVCDLKTLSSEGSAVHSPALQQMLEEGETHPLALHYTHTSNLISGLCSQRHTLQKRDQSKEGVERKEMEQEECETTGKKTKGSWVW